MNRPRIRLMIFCVVAFAIAFRANADSITLKNAVRLSSGATTVTLADIAVIDGPDAQQFANLEVASIVRASDVIELTINDVRRRLTDAGVPWGRVNLNGRSVTVRPGRSGDSHPPMAMASVSIDGVGNDALSQAAGTDAVEGNELVHEQTLRGEIARLLVTAIRAAPTDIRLQFDSGDAEFLSTPVNPSSRNVRYEIQPLGSTSGDRIPVAIRPWTDGKAGERKTMHVQPLLRVKAAALSRDVPKDQALIEDDLESRELWLPPSQAAQTIAVAQAVGGITIKSMNAGELLRDSHLRREAMIRRGDKVMVRCMVGGVVISMQAEARSEGSVGELIELRKPGEREIFMATVTGRAEAVIDLSRG